MEILHSLALAHGVTQRMWSERQHGDKCEVLACAGLYLTTRRYQTRPSGHSHQPLSSARSSVELQTNLCKD